MAEKLWNHVVLRNKIMSIVEDVAPLFKSRRQGKAGKPARFISVKNIEYFFQNFGDIYQFNVKVEFLSDEGSWKHDLVIREFTSTHLFDEEQDYYSKLEAICLFYPNIRPVPILTMDRINQYIVYDSSEGKRPSELNLNKDLIDYQLGIVATALHGIEAMNLTQLNVIELLKYLLNILPFPKYTNEIIRDLLKDHQILLKKALGGFIAKTSFNLDNFRFIPNLEIADITKMEISDHDAFMIDIMFFQPQDPILDRMNDVAMLYAEEAYKEFKKTKQVIDTQNRIKNFIEGYEFQSERDSQMTLEDHYRDGLTLDIHMLAFFWVLVNEQLDQIPENEMEAFISNLVEYSYFLLIHRPFQMYGPQNLSLVPQSPL